ncbi:hypothetical protein, partial [Streptomyces sp. NPDC089799]|uniref:hypothetical protein n=1 Tax=Streptomyces sp. NPDC089799 TaxID=3155066 RepID=UPI0034498697
LPNWAAAGARVRGAGAAPGVLAAVHAGGAAPPRAAAAAAAGSLITVIDNSHADSVVEIDRSANVQAAGPGTAGSDHDGSAVEVLATLVRAARDGARAD